MYVISPFPSSQIQNNDIPEQERDGWYSAHAFERIKIVLRHKFFAVLEGHIPTDAECEALLVVNPETNKPIKSRSKKLKPGKHNMAKGALRPEDAAVSNFTSSSSFKVFVLRVIKGFEATIDFGQEYGESFLEPQRYRLAIHFTR